MKKFSKLLAVVLAIAVVICPMTSVVSYATANGSYKIEATSANDLKLTISSADGFLVYLATVTFDKTSAFDDTYGSNGYVDGMKVISCKFKESGVSANANNTPAITATKSGTSLNILVASTAGAALDLYSEVVIGIHVTESTTASLTKIQAADGGDGQTVESDPTLLAFAGVNSSTGAVDTSSAEYIANGTTNAHEHSFTETSIKETANLKTAATCTADAVYYKTCSVCHVSSNNDSYTFVDTGSMVAHTPSNTKTNKKTDATCTTGTVYYKECSVCHTQLTDTWTDTDAKGHKLTAHAATDSTCTTAGNTLYYTCDNGCGLYFADAAGNTQIEENSWVKVLDSNVHEGTLSTTYSYDANNHWQVYSECGHTANVAAHVYDNACDTTCNVCGAVRSVSPHNYAYDSTGAKTATTHTMKCSVCNDTTTENHNFGAYVSDNNATCGVDGTKTRTCSVCGYQDTVTDTGSALSHSYNYTSNNNGTHNAVCANNASHVITNEACDTAGANGVCSKCGYKAAAVCTHAHYTFVSATPATSSATGALTLYCNDCKQNVEYTVNYFVQYSFAATALNLEAQNEIEFSVHVNSLNNKGAYQEAFAVVKKHMASGNVNSYFKPLSEATDTTKSGYACKSWAQGIPAKEMTDDVEANVYVKYGNQWYNGLTTTKSVESIVLSNLPNAKKNNDTKLMTLFANMLTYGSKAQQYFNYNTDNLADRNLGEYATYVTTSGAAITDNLSNPFDYKSGNEMMHMSYALDLSGKVGLTMTFSTQFYTNNTIGTIAAKTSYTGLSGEVTRDYTSSGDYTYSLVAGKTNQYKYTFDMLPAKRMRTMVTASIYNNSQKVSCDCLISIESLAARNIATAQTDIGKNKNVDQNTKMIALLQAMIYFGDAANAYFG